MFQRWEQSPTWSVVRWLCMLMMKLAVRKLKSPEDHLSEGCRNWRQACQRYFKWTITCADASECFPALHCILSLITLRMHFQSTFSSFYSTFSCSFWWTCSMSLNSVFGKPYLPIWWGSYSPQEDQQSRVSTGGKFKSILQLLTVLIYITGTGMYPHLEEEQSDIFTIMHQQWSNLLPMTLKTFYRYVIWVCLMWILMFS